jgi:eukaryotic-like serine/threonine-protein kinase
MLAHAAVSPDEGLHIGERISAFRIEALLGCGGMGCVYRARHVLDEHVVALKVLRRDQLAHDRAVDRMMREASILATVSHPGMPQFYECGVLPDNRPWIAMELLEGIPFSHRVQRGVVGPGEVVALIAGCAEVLAAAHERGVLHRDLKPDNIFVGGERVVVIDWGIAHQAGGERYTSLNEAMGTPTYMAPEQARGAETDGRIDVYGLGIVAYQALTGRPPFGGATAVEILVQHMNKSLPPLAPRCPEVPLGVVELVELMLVKRPHERPTAVELCELVEPLLRYASGPSM